MRISDWSSDVCSSDLVMNVQEAAELIPGGATGLHEVKLKSGASVKGKTVILSTGARWRQMGVPGEAEYRNKGVAYCPHCDGPLFKGKRVAVIGGGRSEEHTSELQSLMRISYAVFCLQKKKQPTKRINTYNK